MKCCKPENITDGKVVIWTVMVLNLHRKRQMIRNQFKKFG